MLQVDDSHALHGDKAADLLVRHLFAQAEWAIPGICHAVAYHPAAGTIGGDIIDVFRFNGDEVGFSIADISGKGLQAAIHAAMVKYALRAYLSERKTAEEALRALDLLFLESNAFEKKDAFASVFIGIINPERTSMTYASAAHEPVFLAHPGMPAQLLPPTGPLVGAFEGQRNFFRQAVVALREGSLFVAATDGITEARSNGKFYGIDRLRAHVDEHAEVGVDAQLHALMDDVTTYCDGKAHDDIAVLVLRIENELQREWRALVDAH